MSIYLFLFIKEICVRNAKLKQKALQKCHESVAAEFMKKFSISARNSRMKDSVSYSHFFIYSFVNLQVGAQLILLHLRGTQMTLGREAESSKPPGLPP